MLSALGNPRLLLFLCACAPLREAKNAWLSGKSRPGGQGGKRKSHAKAAKAQRKAPQVVAETIFTRPALRKPHRAVAMEGKGGALGNYWFCFRMAAFPPGAKELPFHFTDQDPTRRR